MTKEFKFIGGHVLETKEETRNGIPVGIVAGHIAAFAIDRGDDKFMPGAFIASIAEHMAKGNRPIRLKDHHGRTIGGFPIEFVKEDSKGLFGRGEINLETQQGREAFALAKQGILSDFSIGFSAVDFSFEGDIRVITKAIIWEGSIVDEPMNEAANILEVKKNEADMNTIILEDVKRMTPRELEDSLREGKSFSKQAAKMLASRLTAEPEETTEEKAAREETEQKAAETKNAADMSAILADLRNGLSGGMS